MEGLSFHLKKGDYIIKEGEKSTRFYYILEGSCRVEKEGINQVLGFMREGDIFGEIACLDEGLTSASVMSCQETTVIVIEGYYLNILFQLHPHLSGFFYQHISAVIARRVLSREQGTKVTTPIPIPTLKKIKSKPSVTLISKLPPLDLQETKNSLTPNSNSVSISSVAPSPPLLPLLGYQTYETQFSRRTYPRPHSGPHSSSRHRSPQKTNEKNETETPLLVVEEVERKDTKRGETGRFKETEN